MNIINLLNIEDLPLEDKKLLIDEATEVINSRVLNRLIKALSEEDKNVFLEALEDEDVDKVSKVIEKNNIDIIEILEEESEKLKEELSNEAMDKE